MPKRRLRNRFLSTPGLTSAPTTEVDPEEYRHLEDEYRSRLVSIAMFDDGAGAAITSETTIFDLNLRPPDNTTGIHAHAQTVYEFYVAGKITTDAAAGTTTFRVKLDGTTLASMTGNEANSGTEQSFVYGGCVLVNHSGDCMASIFRTNPSGLYTNNANASNSNVNALGKTHDDTHNLNITIQSTDAGTILRNYMGWVRATARPLDPQGYQDQDGYF